MQFIGGVDGLEFWNKVSPLSSELETKNGSHGQILAVASPIRILSWQPYRRFPAAAARRR